MSPTIQEALRWASSLLTTEGRDANAGELLLLHRLRRSRASLYADFRMPMSAIDWEWFKQAVKRHVEGIPIQYITGEEFFYGRNFNVSEAVLIPRPETEGLVEGVLRFRKEQFGAEPVRYADIGTGSGAIAVTLALEDPKGTVYAVDISGEAIMVAKENAARLGATVQFNQGNLLSPLLESGLTMDILVSNPPYIPKEDIEGLDVLVKDHEPRLALDGGGDGLDVYRKLCADLPRVMNRPGLVAFEIGSGQGASVSDLLERAFGSAITVSVKKDINRHERMVFGVIKF